MAQSYVYPGASDSYVPSLSSDLVIQFSRNPNRFPVNEYIDYRIVDKMRGYYVRMLNDNQGRVIDDTDNVWADGTDSPMTIDGTDSHTFPQYDCVRRRLPKRIGHLAVDQSAWGIVDQEAAFLAQQMMTARVKRIHGVLTTSANWAWGINNANSNYATATTAGGGAWSSASSSNPYIRKSLIYAEIAINQATYGSVTPGDLFVVFNPNVAKTVAISGEFLDFVKQNPQSIPIWEAQKQYQLYGLPENVMGLRILVDDTVYTSSPPLVGGATTGGATFSYTLSDSYAVILTKQRAINPAVGGSFSTFNPFIYEDMKTELYDDPENRRVKLYITENIDDTQRALVAPQSGYLLKVDA